MRQGEAGITLAEAARLLGVHPNTVRNRIKAGLYIARKVATPHGDAFLIEPGSLGLTSAAPMVALPPETAVVEIERVPPLPRSGFIRRQWNADFGAYGGRRARQSFTYEAFVPSLIADLNPAISGDIAAVVVEAEEAVRLLNAGPPIDGLEGVARQLLRAESVASSRIEGLSLSQRRLAEALFDPEKGDITARSVLNNIEAMDTAVQLASSGRAITLDDLLVIHRTLLNTSVDRHIAGVLRTTQNWIGGAADSPRNAEFIPPPEDVVPALLADLCDFINRDDLPAIVQAAIVHAQFETIHPFADGNGRVGRCLIHVVLCRRGLAARYVPPVSVILATNARSYIAGLTVYRQGEVAEWCALFAAATRTAGRRALALTERLQELRARWRAQAANPRRDSTASRLLALLPAYPIIDAVTVERLIGVSNQAARLAIATIEGAGIVRQRNIGRRNRAWVAQDVFDLINTFEWELATPEDKTQERRSAPSARTQ